MSTAMWDHIHKILYKTAVKMYNEELAELDFIVAIIIKAAEDRDAAYFESRDYVDYCRALQLNPDFIYEKIILKAWKIIDDGEVWTPPKEEIEWEE